MKNFNLITKYIGDDKNVNLNNLHKMATISAMEKLENNGYYVNITGGYVTIRMNKPLLARWGGPIVKLQIGDQSTIEVLYKAIVKFIRWYNREFKS